jgi:DNA-binding transcriptional ArsR family regulator
MYIMGLTKTEIFTDEQNRLAVLLKAIAHPARIAILQHIIRSNSCICGNLVAELGLAQPTISQHLRELKNAGLIKGNIEGVSVCYCIEPAAWRLLTREINQFLTAYTDKMECC